MLFKLFLSRFSEALSAFFVLVPTFFLPSKAHTQVRVATLSSAVAASGAEIPKCTLRPGGSRFSHRTGIKVLDADSSAGLGRVSGLKPNRGIWSYQRAWSRIYHSSFSTKFSAPIPENYNIRRHCHEAKKAFQLAFRRSRSTRCLCSWGCGSERPYA